MKILLTGAAGFIGYHTAKALLERGDEVLGYDNMNDYYDASLKQSRLKLLLEYPKFWFYQGDILDREELRKTMEMGCDRVIHLAALPGVRYSFEHPEEYIANNIQGFFNVLDEVRKQNIKGLIYASSSSVYGDSDKETFSEEDRTDLQKSLYGQNKKDNELMAATYHHLYGTHVTGLRFFTVYGEYGRPDMALFLFTDALLKGKPLQIFNHGKQQRDFTYVEDIVQGIIASTDKNYPCEIFNLGRGKTEELMEYVNQVESACGVTAEKEFLPAQKGDVVRTSADINKARRMLDYYPETSIDVGVPKFVNWYRNYYNI